MQTQITYVKKNSILTKVQTSDRWTDEICNMIKMFNSKYFIKYPTFCSNKYNFPKNGTSDK